MTFPLLTYLQPLVTTTPEKVVQQAQKIAQTDPHGWTITLVSIALVFLVLFLLCVIYTLSGQYFLHRRSARQKIREMMKGSKLSAEEVAAAMVALDLYMEEKKRHDKESGVITIRR